MLTEQSDPSMNANQRALNRASWKGPPFRRVPALLVGLRRLVTPRLGYHSIVIRLVLGFLLLLSFVSSIFPQRQDEETEQAIKHYKETNRLMKQGNLARAVAEVNQALELVPSWPAALNMAGVLAEKQDRLPDAIQFYRKTLLSKPDHLIARYNLGNAYLKSSHYKRALRQFEHILKIDSKSAGAILGKSKVFYRQRRLEDALAAALEADRLSPENTEVKLLLADLFFLLGRPEDGLAQVEQLSPLLTDNSGGLKLLARLLFNYQRFEEAAPLLERIMELGVRDPEVLQSLGHAYLAAGRLKKASPLLTAASQADSTRLDSLYLLGICYEMQGHFAEAVQWFEAVLSERPKHIEAIHHLGLVLYRLGRTFEARDRFLLVLGQDPSRSEALYYLALTCGTGKSMSPGKS